MTVTCVRVTCDAYVCDTATMQEERRAGGERERALKLCGVGGEESVCV